MAKKQNAASFHPLPLWLADFAPSQVTSETRARSWDCSVKTSHLPCCRRQKHAWGSRGEGSPWGMGVSGLRMTLEGHLTPLVSAHSCLVAAQTAVREGQWGAGIRLIQHFQCLKWKLRWQHQGYLWSVAEPGDLVPGSQPQERSFAVWAAAVVPPPLELSGQH